MKDLIIEEFIQLVTTFSASRNERAVADLLLAKLRDIGCEDVYEDSAGEAIGGNAGNIHGTLRGSLPGSLLFCAHMDRGEILSPGGIKPDIQEDKIYSDGSTILAADDVAGIVTILAALRELKASGKNHCSVEVLFTVCEEDCVQGSYHADYSRIRSRLAYAMDSNGAVGRIVRAAPSGASLKVELFGRGAHYGSAPENGIDASLPAARILLALKQGAADDDTVANFPVLHAGREATYGICEYAVIQGQVQSYSHRKLLDYIRYFEELCRSVTQGTGLELKFDDQVLYEHFEVSENSTAVKLAFKSLRDLGAEPYTEFGKACLDSHNFNAHGIQSVALAMGYRLNHSNREYQEIHQLIKNTRLIQQIVLEYSNNREEYNL
ncbi:MAG: M20/M25/M40 family metallo-hydrolase [Candidatus Heteroscillospira sp.]|jgi:tripeptide aminopeptidase